MPCHPLKHRLSFPDSNAALTFVCSAADNNNNNGNGGTSNNNNSACFPCMNPVSPTLWLCEKEILHGTSPAHAGNHARLSRFQR